MTQKRRGVTLFELLIVIGVLLILSTVTIFSTLDVMASVDARNIITNMINIKKATLLWYSKNSSIMKKVEYSPKQWGNQLRTKEGKFVWFSEFMDSYMSEITKYLDNSDSITLLSPKKKSQVSAYFLAAADDSKKWYVCYNLGEVKKDSDFDAPNFRIKSKLAGNAKQSGLLGTTDLSDSCFKEAKVYTDQKYVCMLILDFNN